MISTHPIPTSLKIVAILFIVGGIFSVIEVIVSLMNDDININLGVLSLFIGPGLLRLSRGWRTCALVLIWITLIGTPIITVILVIAPGPLDFTLFGQQVGHVSKAWGLVGAVIVFAIALWQYRVLTRPDVRKLFGVEGGS